MQLDDKIVDSLALGTDLSQIDPSTSQSRPANVVGILLLLRVQSLEVRLDGKRHNGGRIVSKVLLQSRLVNVGLVHPSGSVRERWRKSPC